MKVSFASVYGYGMLFCGYAAGMRNGGHDLTRIPWWVDMTFGVALLAWTLAIASRLEKSKS